MRWSIAIAFAFLFCAALSHVSVLLILFEILFWPNTHTANTVGFLAAQRRSTIRFRVASLYAIKIKLI